MVDTNPSRVRNAFGFDMDGTLAHMGDRGPFDYERVGEDQPDHTVVAVVRALKYAGWKIAIFTGRMDTGNCRALTREWLTRYVCDHTMACFCRVPLHMRKDGDFRPDDVIKEEMHRVALEDGYVLAGVFDDRPKVIRMWRKRLEVKTFDVAGRDEF